MINEDKIVCLICEKYFYSLPPHIFDAHDMSSESYKSIFPGHPLQSARSNLRRSKTLAGHTVLDSTKKLMREKSLQRWAIEENRKVHGAITKIAMARTEVHQRQIEIHNRPETIQKHREQTMLLVNDPNCNFGKGWLIHRKESYPEKCFRELLMSWGCIKDIDFFQEYPVWRYSLDFVIVNDSQKIDIEIDGSQHYLIQETAEHDKERDIYLQNLGWQIIRIPAKDIMKHLDTEQIMYIRKMMKTTED